MAARLAARLTAQPASNTDRAAEPRQALLRWYRRNHRRLPWRAEPGQPAEPYHVLVSEAMLQQTQVVTVIDYFKRFVTALPSLEALAQADEQTVLRLWQGLGYYRRARHLQAAARAIVDQHDGTIPMAAAELVKLPGIGRYTAGAIASIAFGRPEPLVDGNVARVLARWEAIEQPIDTPATQKRLWALAEHLVPGRDRPTTSKRARTHPFPGDWNQALMELGAVVCTPRAPRCPDCPVQRFCAASAQGRQEELPRRSPRRKPTAVTHHTIALARGRTFLFEQRPSHGLWANLWQMPTWEADPGYSDATGQSAPAGPSGQAGQAARIATWLASRLPLRMTVPRPIAHFEHTTTHRAITFCLWHAHVEAGRRPTPMQWRRLDQLDDLPLAKPQQRAAALMAEHVQTNA